MATARRLEDRIRELAACLAIAPEDQLHAIIVALQVAMEEYMGRLENRTSTSVLAWPEFPPEKGGEADAIEISVDTPRERRRQPQAASIRSAVR